MSYPGFQKCYLAIDCVILGYNMNGLQVLSVPRKYKPYAGTQSLPTSFIGEKESTDDAAARVIKSITGITDVFFRQLEVFSKPGRDEAARVVSVAYFALVKMDDCKDAMPDAAKAKWSNIRALPKMVFDHTDMIQLALNRLAVIIKNHPLAFYLLPPKFTLTQLQSLYEAVFGCELDKRNFRKRILQMEVLDKLNEKDKTTSKRGAFLYHFNPKKYDGLLQSGNVFSLY